MASRAVAPQCRRSPASRREPPPGAVSFPLVGRAGNPHVLYDRLSLAEVGKLVGADLDEVGELIELGYLPEPQRDGSVGLQAFIALLGRSVSNTRLRRLRIAEPVVWARVFARNPGLLGVVVRSRFWPGSLGEVVQAKLLRESPSEDGDDTVEL